jgi:hypothetical protein
MTAATPIIWAHIFLLAPLIIQYPELTSVAAF